MLKSIAALAASLAASVLLWSGIFCALNAGFDLEGVEDSSRDAGPPNEDAVCFRVGRPR